MLWGRLYRGWTAREAKWFVPPEPPVRSDLCERVTELDRLCSEEKQRACLKLGHCLRHVGFPYADKALRLCHVVEVRIEIQKAEDIHDGPGDEAEKG